MKQFLLKTLVPCLLLFGAASTSIAGTYASGLRVTNADTVMAFDGNFADGSGALLWFTLNGPADTVKVWVLSNNVRIRAFTPMLNVGTGNHNVLWDGKGDDTLLVGKGHYSFEVWTSDTGNSSANWVQVWENPVYLGSGIGLSSRDIDVVQNPMSPDFGNLILTEATTFYGYARMMSVHANGDLNTFYGRNLFPQGTGNVDPLFISIGKNNLQYVSNNTLNSIFVFRDTVLVNTIADIPGPRGIFAHGAGDPTLFIATGNMVIRRAPNGTIDTIFTAAEALGYTQDVALDDSGYVYITFGTSSTTYTNVVRLSPAFAAIDTLTLPDYATHVNISYGADRTSNADDIIYARARGTNGGVFKLDFAGAATTKLFTPSTSTSAYHSIGIDLFGNIYYANPSAEWVRMYTPPSSAPMKWSTKGGMLNVLQTPTTIVDGFDTGEGRFSVQPTFSGSTVGVDVTSTADFSGMEKLGVMGGSQKIVLIDNAASTAAWQVRHLSGVGTPASNYNMGPKGWVGLWLKTENAHPGASVAIGLDDSGDPVTKRSVQLPVINDGRWHLYQWNIADSMQWTPWVVTSGNRTIVGPTVSIDAVWFFAPDSSQPWTIYMDQVSHNATGKIGREPGRGDVTNNFMASALDASWILQNVVKLRPFSPEQYMAGDVNLSSNGTSANAMDAGLILSHLVGKVPYLPWTMPLPPLTNVNGDQPVPLSVILASVSGEVGKKISIPVAVPNDLAGLQAAEMEISFDATMLKVLSVSSSELTKSFMVASNIEDGKVSVAMANAEAVSRGGQILTIEAEILQSAENIVLTADKIMLNDRSVSKVTSVGAGQAEVPTTYALQQNFPNPFNPSTTIEFQLPASGFVELKVYDIAGREVTTLVSDVKNAGTHRIQWNAVDDRGMKVSSGVYFYRISAGQFNQIKKMILLK
ncbi:MAG: FlgD immunoglobulin-like domain containing protein [Bacteroidota bacterium]